MLNGEIKIDGNKKIKMEMGDKFLLSIDPQYKLRCLKFIVWIFYSKYYKKI